MDPLTITAAVSVATSAFNTIKQGPLLDYKRLYKIQRWLEEGGHPRYVLKTNARAGPSHWGPALMVKLNAIPKGRVTSLHPPPWEIAGPCLCQVADIASFGRRSMF